jgi:hypothetical protein
MPLGAEFLIEGMDDYVTVVRKGSGQAVLNIVNSTVSNQYKVYITGTSQKLPPTRVPQCDV